MLQARNWMTGVLAQGKLNPCWGEKRKESTAKLEKRKNNVGKRQEHTGTEKIADKEKTETKDEDRSDRVNWLKAISKEREEWGEIVAEMLRTQNLTPENKAVIHLLLIYTLGKERFGTMEKKKKEERQTNGPSRRQRKCKLLREDINKLKEAYWNAKEDEKEPIEQLRSN